MGGSSLSFGYATWTEQMGDWIDGHNAAFAFFGGAPQLLVPDNAKVAVIKACLYDPMVNRSYASKHLRTFQRRQKKWRAERANAMIFGAAAIASSADRKSVV